MMHIAFLFFCMMGMIHGSEKDQSALPVEGNGLITAAPAFCVSLSATETNGNDKNKASKVTPKEQSMMTAVAACLGWLCVDPNKKEQ